MGKYTVVNVRHSSAFRDPALASAKLYGTDHNEDGVSVVRITSMMRCMTSGVLMRNLGNSIVKGFVRRYKGK
jgi:hypothetical protein